jgi:reverse gyrase
MNEEICIHCDGKIELERRLKFKNDCAKCANRTPRYRGIMMVSHKTGSACQVVSSDVHKMYCKSFRLLRQKVKSK